MEPTPSAQPADALGQLPRGLFVPAPGHRAPQQPPAAEVPAALRDAVELNRLALQAASAERVQELLARVAEIMARLEGELFRLLRPPEPASGPVATPLMRDMAIALVKALQLLGREAPEEAVRLIAQAQARAQAFPASTRALIAQAAALIDPALAPVIEAIVRPPTAGAPSLAVPPALAEVIRDPAALDSVLKLARAIADVIRTGEFQLGPGHGRGGATPAGDAMDGLISGPQGSGSSHGALALASSRLPPPASALLPPGPGAGPGVDVVNISDSGRGLATGAGVDVLVRANQILSGTLGGENLLALSETQIQAGVQILQQRPPQASSPFERMAASFAARLSELRRSDPEGFEKLVGLLRVLAKLNPGRFESFLAEVESGLRDIQASQQAPPAAQTLSALAGQAGQSAARAGAAGQGFTLTIDVQVTQRIDAVIASLRGAGLEAQAVQSESITRIQVTVRLGADGPVQRGDPLIIDLQGDGIELTGRGTAFDLNADGAVDLSAFVKGDDALLFVDQSGDGQLTDGRELFGDQEGDADGYAELDRFDDNRDGLIDAKDAVFEKLRLVYDKNQDGMTQLNEVALLREAGIASISLSRQAVGRTDPHGNEVVARSAVTRTDGSSTGAYEANLTYQRLV